MEINWDKVRKDFPALEQRINGKALAFLDSAASALKPQRVVDRLTQFYALEASNVHRGVHSLSANATTNYEESRRVVQKFISAADENEIIFTRGTTESINLVAETWGRKNISAGDEIILSEMEHHSNLVPWQMLAEEKGAEVKYVSVTADGELDQESYDKLLNSKTKLVSITHCSNTLGTFNPIKQMVKKAHEVGAVFVVDGAQGVTNSMVDVVDLDCDFYAFSGHKIYGPTGVGVLYGKKRLLEELPPYQGGGSMISEVLLEGSTYNDVPFRFEAGTPHIAGAIGLATAIKYVDDLGMDNICRHEESFTASALQQLKSIKGMRILGEAEKRANIFSFVVEGLHPNDIGDILNQEGVAVRTGHHCTQPLMKKLGVMASVRASFTLYNNQEDLDRLCSGIEKAKDLLA